MDLSKIKMVVTDMDGTLLNSNHEVSKLFFSQFKKLQAKGIKFVAASGRQYHSMVSKLENIKDDVIFIAENGAVIKENDREIDITALDTSLTTHLLEIVSKIEGVHFMLCGAEKSYFEEKSITLLKQLKEYYASYKIVSNFNTVKDDIVKIAIYHGISAEQYIYPKLIHLNKQVKVKVSGQNWVDINHIDAHKGNALLKVLAHHNITPNEVLVFGDYNNDIEMLSLTDYSFAMANAHPNVKKVANYETTSNDDYGVERIIEKLFPL